MKRCIKLFSLSLIMALTVLTGCGKTAPAEDTVQEKTPPYDGENYIRMSETTAAFDDPEAAAEDLEVQMTLDLSLSVPTYVTKVDDFWFIVDCYHNKVIYSNSLDTPIQAWNVMCSDAVQPHTMASDGRVYLIDDTENNRVLIYKEVYGKFVETQVFNDIGIRPHFSVYDENTDTFYVWSSESGELYCFRHTEDSSRMYLTDVRKIDELKDTYVRSFTIVGDEIIFPAGLTRGGGSSDIYVCDLQTLSVKKSYTVPESVAGMVQIMPIDDRFYVTVSTDVTGNQDFASILRADSLKELSEGKYEDIYAEHFIGGGTPYNISRVGDKYFLTEHRLAGHSVWSFKTSEGEITDVTAVY